MFRRPSECKHTFSRAVESDKMQRLPCWCYLKWHSLQWCCFWHDRINEVRYACVISSTCNFLFSNFAFFSCFFLYFILKTVVVGQWISKMAKRVFNGWDSQCCCQLVSVESHWTVCRDVPWWGPICPMSLNHHFGLSWTCVHALQSRRICVESHLTLLSPCSFESTTYLNKEALDTDVMTEFSFSFSTIVWCLGKMYPHHIRFCTVAAHEHNL